MSDSILNRIDEGGQGPVVGDVLGDRVRSNTTNKDLGRKIIKTDLAGTWIGFGNGVVVQPDDTVSKFDNAVLWFRIQANGDYLAGGWSMETDGQITLGAEFSGAILAVAGNTYLFVNGDPDNPGYGEILSAAAFDRGRTCGAGFLMDWTAVSPPVASPGTFLEMNYVYKISNDVDSSDLTEYQRILGQWL